MNWRTYHLVNLAVMVMAVVWISFPAGAETVPANPGFEEGKVGDSPEGWRVPTVPGYQVLTCDENPKTGKQCLTIKRGTEKPGPFGNVMQRIDAASLRGKRVRYRAAVRTAIEGEDDGQAQLWLRVELTSKKGQRAVGFFDNMARRPIRKKEWDYYEIVGDISEDAEAICLGMFLKGNGQAWLDDVSLEVLNEKAEVTGSTLATTSFDKIGPGLLQIFGSMELIHITSLGEIADQVPDHLKVTNYEQKQNAEILIPLPMAYGRQVPLTYSLSIYPPEAVNNVTVYKDTPYNHIAKLSVAHKSRDDKVYIKFRSCVLVGPSSFSDVPEEVKIPDKWPDECQPWLTSTWCVESQHEEIQALSREICDGTDNLMEIIGGVQDKTGAIVSKARGEFKNLTATAALTSPGSCTSNANLLAALLRASNVPARVLAGYPSWSGPLQTHYIVEAYVPNFGWYPIEPTLRRSPWPNEYQVNVAIIPPDYESQELCDDRTMNASGVPYLSLTEMTDAPSGVFTKGTLGPRQNCDHECSLVRTFAADDDQWEPVLEAARLRWQRWLASEPKGAKEGLQMPGLEPGAVDAKSASELMEALTRLGGENRLANR